VIEMVPPRICTSVATTRGQLIAKADGNAVSEPAVGGDSDDNSVDATDHCAAADLEGVDERVVGADNVLARNHYAQYRQACPNTACAAKKFNFCRSCRVAPYHTGFDCADYRSFLEAPKCRFCRTPITQRTQRTGVEAINQSPLLGQSGVCNADECTTKLALCCTNVLPCGHACFGYRNELVCPPCLHSDCAEQSNAGACVLWIAWFFPWYFFSSQGLIPSCSF
jgi:hypothetical protein